MSAIDVTGLRKRYRRLLRPPVDALRGVDLSVPEGSAFGLIGPNGAGKTTFIKSLLGIIQPTDGTVRVLGGSPLDAHVRARIAKGMRQRLGLASALLGNPELLILDEPTDGIDPMGRVEVRRILQEEVRRGATLFLNSHLLAETERVCDRVAILSGGQVVRQGRLEELLRGGVRWTVRFAPGVEAGALAAAGFLPGDTEGLYLLEAPGLPELNAALDRARASGALMMELRREGQDLEQVLLSTVGGVAA